MDEWGLFRVEITYFHYLLAGGSQFKVTPNDLIVVNQIPADVGEKIFLEKVRTVMG